MSVMPGPGAAFEEPPPAWTYSPVMSRTALVLAVGMLAAAVSTFAQNAEIGPPPGRLVDIGGRRLHLHCTGSGSPTVVIEAGASSFAIDLIVLTRGRGSAAAQQTAHAEIARMSSTGRHAVVADSYHEIHLSHPEVVANAVADVVVQVRSKTGR